MNTAFLHRQKLLEGCPEVSTEAVQPFLKRAWSTLKVWHWRQTARARLRVELQVMDVVRTEKDTGLPTGALRQEAYKPFWKA